jgi:hypothetical protein
MFSCTTAETLAENVIGVGRPKASRCNSTPVPGPSIRIDGVEMNSATRIILRRSRLPAMRR